MRWPEAKRSPTDTLNMIQHLDEFPSVHDWEAFLANCPLGWGSWVEPRDLAKQIRAFGDIQNRVTIYVPREAKQPFRKQLLLARQAFRADSKALTRGVVWGTAVCKQLLEFAGRG